MIAEAMVKAAAVGGIVMVWTKFTLESFKMCKQIVYPNKQFYRCDDSQIISRKNFFHRSPEYVNFAKKKNTCAMNAMNVILTIEKIFPEI